MPLDASDYGTYIADSFVYTVNAIAVDRVGNTYATGVRTIQAASPSPLTDVFVTKIDPGGNLTLLATFSGKGSESGNSIALDPTGNIYVAGSTSSPDFPLHLPLQSAVARQFVGPSATGFLAKISSEGTVLYSTYFGGTKGQSYVKSVIADGQGNAYITGGTNASDYPHTSGLPAIVAYGGNSNQSAAFFAKISPNGDKVVYAGGLGSTLRFCTSVSGCFYSIVSNMGNSIAVDASGNAYIAGNAYGSGLGTTSGALLEIGFGAFVAKVNSEGTDMVYVTYLSKGANTTGFSTISAISADDEGNAYLAGSTADPTFPVTTGAFQAHLANPKTEPNGGSTDAFVAKLNPRGSGMVWATFLGGAGNDTATSLATDPSGGVWVSGTADSTDFPVSAGFPDGREYLIELNSQGSALLYGQRLSAKTAAVSIGLDSQGVIHAAGSTGLVSTITPALSSSSRIFGLASAAYGDLAARVSPGELISIYGLHFGPAAPVLGMFNSAGLLPTTLGGVQVSIGGLLAPLLYVSDTQINAVVPFGLSIGALHTALTITGLESSPLRVIVEPRIPEVFRAAGAFAAAAINQDGTVNSPANPAKAGSYVSVWATGLGWSSSYGIDGKLQTSADSYCSCFIERFQSNPRPVVTSYSGAAPGLVSGIIQINFQVAGPGIDYSLVGSQHGFSIAVVP